MKNQAQPFFYLILVNRWLTGQAVRQCAAVGGTSALKVNRKRFLVGNALRLDLNEPRGLHPNRRAAIAAAWASIMHSRFAGIVGNHKARADCAAMANLQQRHRIAHTNGSRLTTGIERAEGPQARLKRGDRRNGGRLCRLTEPRRCEACSYGNDQQIQALHSKTPGFQSRHPIKTDRLARPSTHVFIEDIIHQLRQNDAK